MTDPRVIDAAIGAARFPVVVGEGVSSQIAQWWPEGGAAAFVMYDAAVRHIAEPVMAALSAHGVRVVDAPVPSGERSKSFAELERLSRLAATEGIRRSDTVVGIGGGVIE